MEMEKMMKRRKSMNKMKSDDLKMVIENWWGQGGKMFVPFVLSWKDWKRMLLVDFMEILIFV